MNSTENRLLSLIFFGVFLLRVSMCVCVCMFGFLVSCILQVCACACACGYVGPPISGVSDLQKCKST